MKHRSSLVACLFAFLFPTSALAAEGGSEKEKPTEKKDEQSSITVGSVQTRLWALSGDVRVFPFGGAFYLGLRGGYRALFASASLSASGIGSYSESVEIASLFVNPRIGFLRRLDPLVIGFEAGLQLP